MKYVIEDGTRRARMVNACVCFIKHFDEWKATGAKAVGIQRLRDTIREETKLDKLEGEARLGDYRANGDAIGGHGLHLNLMKHNGTKGVIIADELGQQNLDKCKKFLKEGSGEAPVILT